MLSVIGSRGWCVALLALATYLVTCLAPNDPALAQARPDGPSAAQARPEGRGAVQARPERHSALDETSIKFRMNQWTVGLAAGLPDGGGFVRFASEMARTMDDGDNMRLIPMVTRGTTTNIADLLYLRGVDVAITYADAFDCIRSRRDFPISTIAFATLCSFSSPIFTSTLATSSSLSRT
jgi:hypothetical protein